MTALAYSLVKFEHFINYDDPQINNYLVQDHFTQEDKISLNAINFDFAFTIEGFYDQE